MKIFFEELDELGLETAAQKISSAGTSMNKRHLPAVYSKISFQPGDVVLDYGGGKFDNAKEALAEQGVNLYIYDPYNRSAEYNKNSIAEIRKNGGADAAVCSNVLNVIAEPESRNAVIKNIYNLLKSGGSAYFTVYVGNKSGVGKATSQGYQLNRHLADYLDEISAVFSNVTKKGSVIIARK